MILPSQHQGNGYRDSKTDGGDGMEAERFLKRLELNHPSGYLCTVCSPANSPGGVKRLPRATD